MKSMPKDGGVFGVVNGIPQSMDSEQVAEFDRECRERIWCVWDGWQDGTPGTKVCSCWLVGSPAETTTLNAASVAAEPQHQFQTLLVSFGCGSLVACLVADDIACLPQGLKVFCPCSRRLHH